MNITVVKEFTFESAHFLPDYQGKCRHMHGHSYKLLVGVIDEIDSVSNMVIDFSQLKKIVNDSIVEELDHKLLNEVDTRSYGTEFPKNTPTAERMVEWVVDVLRNVLYSNYISARLNFVRLYETETSYAEWRQNEDK